jgi:hypothetical protein
MPTYCWTLLPLLLNEIRCPHTVHYFRTGGIVVHGTQSMPAAMDSIGPRVLSIIDCSAWHTRTASLVSSSLCFCATLSFLFSSELTWEGIKRFTRTWQALTQEPRWCKGHMDCHPFHYKYIISWKDAPACFQSQSKMIQKLIGWCLPGNLRFLYCCRY